MKSQNSLCARFVTTDDFPSSNVDGDDFPWSRWNLPSPPEIPLMALGGLFLIVCNQHMVKASGGGGMFMQSVKSSDGGITTNIESILCPLLLPKELHRDPQTETRLYQMLN